MMNDIKDEIQELRFEVGRLQLTLGTLISWMAASANSPINVGEAKVLIEMIQKGWQNNA